MLKERQIQQHFSKKLQADTWDLVISDLAMPGGGGFVALKKIKAYKKKLPVVILSTYPAEQYEPRVLKAGAEDFVSKDSLPAGLIKSVRRILGIQKNTWSKPSLASKVVTAVILQFFINTKRFHVVVVLHRIISSI